MYDSDYSIKLEDEIIDTKVKLSKLDKESDNYEIEYNFYHGYLTGLLFAYNTWLSE